MAENNYTSQSIEKLERRLEKLKEQQSLFGVTADPSILMQIEDIEHILDSVHSEAELQKEIGKIFFTKEIDYESLAKAMDSNKGELLASLEKGIKYEIELLKAEDTLALILIDNSGKTLQTLPPSPSIDYVKVLSAYMKGQRHNSHKIDSYVTPYIVSRTRKVFLEFYSGVNVQNSISLHIKSQLEQAKNRLSNSIYVDYKETMGKAVDKLLDGGLSEFIRDSVVSHSFEESMTQVLNELRTDAVVGTAVGASIITILAILGFSIQGSSIFWFLIPVVAIIITYKALTFKESLAKKTSKKLTDAVAVDLFSKLNVEAAKIITEEVVNKVIENLNDNE